jgi:transcriptional regulator with XRE-family HTH domain
MSEEKGGLVKVDGSALERLRKAAGLTIEDLADKSGVSTRTLNSYTAGKEARISSLKYVADALGVEFRTLLKQPPSKELLQSPVEKRVQIDINVSIPYETFEESSQLAAFLAMLQSVLSPQSNINVIRVKEGSTIITVEMDIEDVVKLLELFFKESLNYPVPESRDPSEFSVIQAISFPNSSNTEDGYTSIWAKTIKVGMERLDKFDTSPTRRFFDEAVLQFPKMITAINVQNPAFLQSTWKSIKDRYPQIYPLRVFFKDNFPEFDEKIILPAFGLFLRTFDPMAYTSKKRIASGRHDSFDDFGE